LRTQSALSRARLAGRLALDKKGFDVKILKLKSLSTVCDYFVIASGSANVHVRAIAEGVEDGMRQAGHKPMVTEGARGGNWVLLDYVDFVVHIFYEPTRRFYALEKLWGDAPVELLNDEPVHRGTRKTRKRG
jgi:ribosome-associated protein